MQKLFIVYHQSNPKLHECTFSQKEVNKIKDQLTKKYNTLENEWKSLSFEILPWSGYFIKT